MCDVVSVKALKFDPENESHKASLGAVKLRLTAQTRQVPIQPLLLFITV